MKVGWTESEERRHQPSIDEYVFSGLIQQLVTILVYPSQNVKAMTLNVLARLAYPKDNKAYFVADSKFMMCVGVHTILE